ncbi:MAG TPA: hypothetical protein PJ986_04085 [Gammaproteobacteria bacterium]|nr:hypothetical protein [Gammaproteobacteria bacterium]
MTTPHFTRLPPDRRQDLLAVLLLDLLEPARYDQLVTDWRAGTLSLDRLVAEAHRSIAAGEPA